MKIVLLDTLTFGDTNLDAFNDLGKVEIYQTTSTDEINDRVIDATVIVTNKVVISKETMQNAHNLKLICVAATGMNNVDLDAAKEFNIEVKNVVSYSTDSVIQHTFSMLFYLIGHSSYYDNSVKNGTYSNSKVFTDISHPFFEIKGKKWGIIGLGNIGNGVAKIATAFGADVFYYSTSGKNHSQPYKRVQLKELLESCDIISIHAPLNENTKDLLNYEELSTCKDKTTILNLGRGGIINEDAIAKIIDEKDLYFGLDVLEKEPMLKNHVLLNIKNIDRLYISPHIAWTSVEARDRLISVIIKNIKSSL